MGGARLDTEALISLRSLASTTSSQKPGLSNLPGNFQARRRGQGQETADIRAYVLGDDARAVDRNVTARTGNLHVRVHQADRDRTILLVADFRPSMLWGVRRAFRSVAAAEALALAGWRAIDDGARVGLLALINDGHEAVPARSRPRAMLDVIGAMVRAHEAAMAAAPNALSDRPLDAAFEQVLRIMDRNTEVVIASGFDAPGPDFAHKCRQVEDRGMLHRLEIGAGMKDSLPAGRYRMQTPSGEMIHAQVDDALQDSERPYIIDPGKHPAQMIPILEAML